MLVWQFLLSSKFYSSTRASQIQTKAAVLLAYLIKPAFATSLNIACDELCRNAPPNLHMKIMIALMEDNDFHTRSCGIKDAL